MEKNISTLDEQNDKYVPHHVMEPGPLSDKKLSGTWKDYVSVTKVGIILSNLLTVITGIVLAASTLDVALADNGLNILYTLLGTALIIASGTCLNNYIDRDIDQKMSRTKNRALVEGRLNPKHVLIMGFLLAILGTALLVLVNIVTTLVALFGLFVYVVVYTMWWKRKHSLNTVIGSLSGAVPPVIGWTAISGGSIDAGAWILFLIMFLWQPPHFLALAMRRCEDYRAAGVPMLPVVKGFHETKKQMLNYVFVLVPGSLLLFMYTSVQYAYVWIALALGIIWIVLTVKGFYAKDDLKWARQYFLFSLIYMTVLFVSIIILS